MPVARLAKQLAVVALAATLAACNGFDFILAVFVGATPKDSAGPRAGTVQVNVQLGGCSSQVVSASATNVACSLLWSGGYSGVSTMTFQNLPAGTSVGQVHGGVLVQAPAAVSNLRGTYSGAASGTLSIVKLGVVPADNASSIVPEAGMALWVVESPPNPGTYQFQLSFDEDGTTALPMPVKVMLVDRVAANGRTYYPPMYPCTTNLATVPALSLPETATPIAINVSGLMGTQGCVSKSYDFGPVVQVVEFYNAALNHYFITHVPSEIALLDAGTTIKGWARTNQTFKAYLTAQAGTTDVCRIYIIPVHGDSHFFGRGQAECDATMAAHPDFILEEPKFMAMILPAAGVCPAGTVKVYRVFNNRPDANHRYMTNLGVRAVMVQLGWIVEGDGPDAVVMCGPA